MKTSTKQREELLSAAETCERLARSSSVQEERREMAKLIIHEHTIKAGLMAQKMKQLGGLTLSGHEERRKPIQIEGQDWAYVESRMPAEMWWHLYKQPNYGWEGLRSDEGQRELRKAYPVLFPKQVTGKISVGWRNNPMTEKKVVVKFGPNTINLA
jgi:hypothetical protein